MLTVGPVAENCFLVRREGSDRAADRRPGRGAGADPRRGRADRRRRSRRSSLTHCHFDHIGAVAPVAAATGAPVYCPRDRGRRSSPTSWPSSPGPGFGPYESYEADETVAGGETLELAGPRARRDLHPRPQPRPRHLLGPRRGRDLLRRRPLPGLGRPGRPARRRRADAARARSARCSTPTRPETASIPGTWGSTTLGAERATNPFLAELAR